MSDVILRARGIGWRSSHAIVLERVTFEVSAGEFVAVMGRNGAGKSTLLDILAGLRPAAEGEVLLLDRSLHAWPAPQRARFVAHLPQTLRGDLSLTAEALVSMGRYVHASSWYESGEDVSAVADAMERCECLQFRHRRMATLSGGERQRVFLAACLAQRPRVLLLDEPATFLDVDQQLQCFSLLRAEAARGTSCVAVTHDVNLALTFCTRLIVLLGGTVAYDLAAAGALQAPEWLRAISNRLAPADVQRSMSWIGYR